MKIKDLNKYSHIIIQCHNIPDADTIGAGYALQRAFKSMGKEALLVYGGPAKITKPSLLMLMEALDIKIEYLKELPKSTDLLITVDCQRGAGNVFNFDLPEKADVIVIDHHRAEIDETENTIILPGLSSCCTVVWDMLVKEGFSLDHNMETALYYGLFTDTNGLSELRHPLDRDLAENEFDSGLVKKLKNSAITTEDLTIIAKTLRNREIIGNIGLFAAEPCDANLLGFTSDIAQQVVQMDCCVVYCHQPYGIKLSVRSSCREIMANEFAAFLCKDAGSGGGSVEKGGGFISDKGVFEIAPKLKPKQYLKKRLREYMKHYDLVYAGNNKIDFASMKLYKKMPYPVWFAKSAEVFPSGTKITVRTLEGDVDTVADENIYLMVGIRGEVYPIKKTRFESSYNVLGEPYEGGLEYTPAILNRLTGERKEIAAFAKTCVPKDEKLVRAVRIEKDMKVFSQWDTSRYFCGFKNDWLAVNEDDYDDCYIIRYDIFADSYAPV